VSNEELLELAEEQAALRRVATLVARGVPPEELFAAVVDEVGVLLPIEYTYMGRYEHDRMITFVAASSATGDSLPSIGSRLVLGGNNVATLVFETARPARVDGLVDASGPIGSAFRVWGVQGMVGTPIVVEGRLWGVMIAISTLEEPIPADTEGRLANFTELLATAIANAESRGGLARLADEQAALRRVATLVARGVPQEELFAAVTEEVGKLLCVEYAGLARYEPDGETMTIVAIWGRTGDPLPPGGRRQTIGGKNVSTMVFETGRAARIDGYSDASGPLGLAAREYGITSGLGTPIVVEGRLWGAMTIYSTSGRQLTADAEGRLGSFTALLATAIANAESRDGLARLAEEQAALRRVATLVATGVPPEELFAAVADEVVRLLPVDFAHLGRYESDGTITVLAASGTTADRFPVGRRWKLAGKNLATSVVESGRPGRIDGYLDASGPLGVVGDELGIRSSAGSPVIVEGDIWGVVIVGLTLREQPLPGDIEARLGSFTELVATAVANVESRAALAASRARIVAAADESRRRIERDLHDGAQQRLVHAVIVLKLALRALSSNESDGGELVAEALRNVERANSELRELAHGILPAALTRGGLQAGVAALVARTSLPVSIDVSVGRLPAGLEATAYFVVSEALANVVKHARAETASVTAQVEHGQLRVEVRDDGVGGARAGDNTGLRGLEDRVSALDGRLVLDSRWGAGTRVCALLPISDGA
jgi:signal transduction histidine kinase